MCFFGPLDQQQRRNAPRSARGSGLQTSGFACQTLQHLAGRDEECGETRVGGEFSTPDQDGRRCLVHQPIHMMDGLDDGVAETLTISRQQSQPCIGAIDGAFDGRLDQRFGIASACRPASAKKEMEKTQCWSRRRRPLSVFKQVGPGLE